MSGQNFSETLRQFKGFKIGMFLNGGQFVEGTLLDITGDHVALESNSKVVYYAKNQIHALSKSTKDFEPTTTFEMPTKNTKQLQEVLCNLKYNWVTITSLNDQTFAGFLSRIYDDHVILINKEDQLVVPKSFILNVQQGESEEQSEEKNSNQSQDNGNGQDNKQTKGSDQAKADNQEKGKKERKRGKKNEESSGQNVNENDPYFPREIGNGINWKNREGKSSTNCSYMDQIAKRAMLEAQFCSLKKQAERNMCRAVHNCCLTGVERVELESQYCSLMKHAERHCKCLRDCC